MRLQESPVKVFAKEQGIPVVDDFEQWMCHSREDGNPGGAGAKMDSRLRGNDN
jgi:hypothetical protein